AEASAPLAIANDDERGEAEALAALHGLGDAIDVDKLFNELLATFIVVTAPTAIVTTAAASATAAITATATSTARTTAARSVLLLGLDRSSLGDLCDLGLVGVGLVGLVFFLHSRTPVRLRGQRRR